MNKLKKPLVLIGLAIIALAVISWIVFPGWRKQPGGGVELLGKAALDLVAFAGGLTAILLGLRDLNKPKEPPRKEAHQEQTGSGTQVTAEEIHAGQIGGTRIEVGPQTHIEHIENAVFQSPGEPSGRAPEEHRKPFQLLLSQAKSSLQNLLETDRGKTSFFHKYNPSLYVRRGSSEQDFWMFLGQAGRKCFVVTGRAGHGKTNLICELARQAAQPSMTYLPVLLDGAEINFDRCELEQVILSGLPQDALKDTGCTSLAELGALAQKNDACVVILLDAINEVKGREPFRKFNHWMDRVLNSTANLPVYFCLTCRDQMWPQFSQSEEHWAWHAIFYPPGDLAKGSRPEPGNPTLRLGVFGDEHQEFITARENYFDWYRIQGELTGDAAAVCHDPLMLRVLCQAYTNRTSDNRDPNGLDERGQPISWYPLGTIDRLRRKEVFDQFASQKRRDVYNAVGQAVKSRPDRAFDADDNEIYQLTSRYLMALAKAMYQNHRAFLTLDEAFAVAEKLDHNDYRLGKDRFASDPNAVFFRFVEVGILDLKEADRFSFVFELYFEYILGRCFATQVWKNILYEGQPEDFSRELTKLIKEHDQLREEGFTNLFGSLLFAVLVAEGTPEDSPAVDPAEKVYYRHPEILTALLNAMTDLRGLGLFWAQQACAIIRELDVVQAPEPLNSDQRRRLEQIINILKKLSHSNDFVIMWDLENTLRHIARSHFDITLAQISDWARYGKGLQPIFATRALAGLSRECSDEPGNITRVVSLICELARMPGITSSFWVARSLIYTALQMTQLRRNDSPVLAGEEAANLRAVVRNFAIDNPNPYTRGAALAALPFLTITPLDGCLEEVEELAMAERTTRWARWNLAFALRNWPEHWPIDKSAWVWRLLKRFADLGDDHLRYAVDRCRRELAVRCQEYPPDIDLQLRGSPWLAELVPGPLRYDDSQKLGIVYAPVFMEPEYDNHVECRERLQNVLEVLEQAGQHEEELLFNWITPRRVTAEQLGYVHNDKVDKHRDGSPWPDYVELVKQASQKAALPGGGTSGVGPSELRYESYDVALWSAGSVLEAIDYVMKSKALAAFALNRPPGHLANNTICLFNNIAIGARYAMINYARQKKFRVFIVDCDAHQGKHTHYSFWRDPDVVYFSMHVWGNYAEEDGKIEHTGKEQGQGYNFNIPYPENMGDEGYNYIVDHLLVPALRQFQPDLILVSAGFDGHFDDPLTQPSLLTEKAYIHLAEKLREVALEIKTKVVGTFEGGYSLEGTARSLVHMLAVFGDWPAENRAKIGFSTPPDTFAPLANGVQQAHGRVRTRLQIMAEECQKIPGYAFDPHSPEWQAILDSDQPVG